MKNVAIYLVHPNYEESRINKALTKAAKKLENVTVYNLYDKYPNFNIDVEAEQKILLSNDIHLFQFPLYWLSSPSLLREWFDQTFSYNFAYGDQYLLEGKGFAVATTAGGSLEEYTQAGSNKLTVKEYLNPFFGTANYTKMNYKDPFVVYATYVLSDEELNTICEEYVEYIQKISA